MTGRIKRTLLIVATAVLVACAGCATPAPAEDPQESLDSQKQSAPSLAQGAFVVGKVVVHVTKGTRLHVNVNPNLKGKRAWKVRVLKADGDGWRQVCLCSSKGRSETFSMKVTKGTYRLRVLPRKGSRLGAARLMVAVDGQPGGTATPGEASSVAPPNSTFKANCIVSPHACGYPDETNTGVPAGVRLTRVPQEATRGPGWTWRADLRAVYPTADGSVISNLHVDNGKVVINKSNVTLRNLSIASHGPYPIECTFSGDSICRGLVVESAEIAGLSRTCAVGIAFSGYTARRVNIHGCQDGLKADANALIEDSYVHDLVYYVDPVTGEDTHNDGVQTTGGSRVTLRHNTFKLGSTEASAVVQFGTESGTANSLWTIENNLLDGGGWVLNTNATMANTVVKGNRFTRRYGYGVGEIPGSTWVGNYFDDNGAPAR